MLGKELWQAWLQNEVTQERNRSIQERIDGCKDQIVSSTDPDHDRFLKGMIWAFNEVLEAKPDSIVALEELEENQDEVFNGNVSS